MLEVSHLTTVFDLPTGPAPAVDEIFKELRGMVDKPLTDEELKKAKDAMANSLPGAFESSANAAGSFSNVYVYDLGLNYFTNYPARVDADPRRRRQQPAEGPIGGHKSPPRTGAGPCSRQSTHHVLTAPT